VTADQVLQGLKQALGARLKAEVRPRKVGVKRPLELQELWCEIGREDLLLAVRTLKNLGPLHTSIISGRDAGETIELLYHLAVGFGTPGGEVMVTFRLQVPKSDPVVPSITGILPGAETTEREKIEFLGVEFAGIPTRAHVFLPDDFPYHPWRKDEPGIEKTIKRMVEWEEKRHGGSGERT